MRPCLRDEGFSRCLQEHTCPCHLHLRKAPAGPHHAFGVICVIWPQPGCFFSFMPSTPHSHSLLLNQSRLLVSLMRHIYFCLGAFALAVSSLLCPLTSSCPPISLERRQVFPDLDYSPLSYLRSLNKCCYLICGLSIICFSMTFKIIVGGESSVSCSLFHPQYLKECLVHSRCLINIDQ